MGVSGKVVALCSYETTKLVRIHSVRLGSLKWTLNAAVLLFICVLMLWNRKYQQFDQVVSSVTAKVKGVARMQLPGEEAVIWDEADYSGPSQDKNSFFVVTNVIVTKNQKQGRCPEPPSSGRRCRHHNDCKRGAWEPHSHGIQTGSCVKFDALARTCEVAAWCPVEAKHKPPRPALLASAEKFTVLIKNNIHFPAFNFIRRNILPEMTESYLTRCQRGNDSLCPVFTLGDVVHQAGGNFSTMAVEGGVIGIQIKWDCNLDHLTRRCLPTYSFRRLDQKESNKTLSPGFNFRFAKYKTVDRAEERTLYKAFGIRFDIMVFGQAGKFSFIQLVVYIGSTLSYYALTTVLMDWLIGTTCYAAEEGQNYSERKVESIPDKKECILCVSYVDEENIRLVKMSHKKRLQDVKTIRVQTRKEDIGHMMATLCLLPDPQPSPTALTKPQRRPPSWCKCGGCSGSPLPQEELCCRRSNEGACVATSALFDKLSLQRPLLEALLVYQEPLAQTPPSAAALRRCAYRQYIVWRLGVPPADARPAIPRCCVMRIREAFPSLDGRYGGFALANEAEM
ncbi:P2X purinoceptor 4-like isoform X1 [Phyllopteryx taeniolatus]|uniref:P2X purinoceptor 4-like isoform X1 n=1 Tax=Phyllopteryx taeniolatus TaxID=161469 RepID=UPI002AD59074|nr:P2X purinoceptor 4-like isoform X1 [Phyllopteryx taeniolatus]XP_061625087.1 P2X purinoceptor 4-like isoform X1 [Phyllopteryx taeniolatus]